MLAAYPTRQLPSARPSPLVCRELLAGGTAQRAIGLEGKVATSEAIRDPAQGDFGASIPLPRGSQVGSRSLLSQMGRGKRGGTYGIQEQVMAQFQRASFQTPWAMICQPS